GKVIALFDLVGPLLAGKWRLIKGHMANQVEGIHIPAHVVAQGLPDNPVLGQLVDNGRFAFGIIPLINEIVQRLVLGLNRLAGVVLEGFGDQLAVGVVVLHALIQLFNRHAGDAVFNIVTTALTFSVSLARFALQVVQRIWLTDFLC